MKHLIKLRRLTRKDWWRIYMEDRRWTKTIQKNIGQPQLRSSFPAYVLLWRMFKLIIRIFFPPYSISAAQYQLVQFGTDEITGLKIRHPSQFQDCSPTWKSYFFGRTLPHQLALLQELFQTRPYCKHKWLITPCIKLLITLISNCLASDHCNTIFLVKQDYFGASSLLVSISKISTVVKVIGLQHGLMSEEEMKSTRIYPGIRTNTEFAFSNYYGTLFRSLKPSGCEVQVMGPPWDICAASSTSAPNRRRFIFISSGDLSKPSRAAEIIYIGSFLESSGYTFEVRPHPSEIKTPVFGFARNIENQERILDCDANKTIFIGYFSTLLLQLCNRGFSCIWIKSDASPSQAFLTQASSIPNAKILTINDLCSVEQIARLTTEPLTQFQSDPFANRLLEILNLYKYAKN